MKISIITPYKNSYQTFADTYKSVINQTYKNFEWIIVDDKSHANERKELEELAIDKRVRIFSNNNEPGPGGARNYGLNKITGDFLTFIDSDDNWQTNYLEVMSNLITDSKGVIFSGYKRFDCEKNKYIDAYLPTLEIITKDNILRGNPLSCLTTFIDLGKLNFIPQFGNYIARNDLVFFYRILNQIEYAKPIRKSLGTYNLIPNSISRNKYRALWFQWLVCREEAKLSMLLSMYNCLCWMIYGIKKYYLNREKI